jgi:hypothetical protein
MAMVIAAAVLSQGVRGVIMYSLLVHVVEQLDEERGLKVAVRAKREASVAVKQRRLSATFVGHVEKAAARGGDSARIVGQADKAVSRRVEPARFVGRLSFGRRVGHVCSVGASAAPLDVKSNISLLGWCLGRVVGCRI